MITNTATACALDKITRITPIRHRSSLSLGAKSARSRTVLETRISFGLAILGTSF